MLRELLIAACISALVSATLLLFSRETEPSEEAIKIVKETLDRFERLGIAERVMMPSGMWGVRLTVDKEEAKQILRDDYFLQEAKEVIAEWQRDSNRETGNN